MRGRVETIECPFCPGAPSEPAIEEDGWTGRRCSSCNLIFLSPRPSPDEVAELYRSDSAHLSAESHIESHDSLINRVYNRHALRLLRRHVRGGALLEIGAGSGAILELARDAGFDVYGVEANPAQAAYIRDVLRIPCAESTESLGADLGRASHDVIYHRDVLSHFPDPVLEFRRFNDVLAPGGRVVFETGNFGDVDPAYFRYVSSFQYPDHLFFFSERSIDRLLEESGFRRERTYRFSLVPQLEVASRARAALTRGGGGRGGSANGDGGLAAAARSGGPARRSALFGYEYVLYLLRFGAGSVAPKERRPQTMVVVARKR